MIKCITTAPPNSAILLMDPSADDIPESMQGRLVASTPSCLAIGTLSEVEGTTSIALSNEEVGELDMENMHLVYDGHLNTATGNVLVCTVRHEPLLAVDVPPGQCRVRVWANHDFEPNKLSINITGERHQKIEQF
jgi:hypothetical protein